ncbi:MAG TPA: hypothetical protein VH142_22335 [Polyangiaceae bacterium]|nr:hypothetical protein [Polyangiaceae bacterium]
MLGVCALTACGAPEPRAPNPNSNPPAHFPDRALSNGDFGTLRSARFSLQLPLPDYGGWSIDDRSNRWLVATHATSESALYVRAWREGSVVAHQTCEAAARSWRPDLLGPSAAALTARRKLDAPAGFDTEVGFGVVPANGGLSGVAAAFGARIRDCVVLVFTTHVSGADAERALAARLAFVTERVFGEAQRLKVEDRFTPPSH